MTARGAALREPRAFGTRFRIVVGLWLLVAVVVAVTTDPWPQAPLVGCGPFAAAVATEAKFPGRQGSVAQSTLTLAPWGLASLAMALVSPGLIPARGGASRVRLLAWTAGWMGWFACALMSWLYVFGE